MTGTVFFIEGAFENLLYALVQKSEQREGRSFEKTSAMIHFEKP